MYILISIQVPGKTPSQSQVIDIAGHVGSNMASSDVVRTLFYLEKDFNMLHPDQRMHINLGDVPINGSSPAA